jgi:hypothetical protein
MSRDWGIEIPGGFFDEERHRYRDERGVIVPSSTQVFTIHGMNDFSAANQEDVEWKRLYGDAVHEAVRFLVEGDLDTDTLDSEVEPAVTGIGGRLKDIDFQLEAVEERMIANCCGMKYGMTLDLRGTCEHLGKRRSVVIDEKTGSKFSQTWMWQVGSYLIPQPRVPLGWLGMVLQVEPRGKVAPHFVPDVGRAKMEFQALLASAILKLNYGYANLGG